MSLRTENILLIEGCADRTLFSALMRELKISDVTVCPPMDLGGVYNGKNNAIDLLPSLISQMEHGHVKRLGIIVDADFKHNHSGHTSTYKKVTQLLSNSGYKIPSPYPSKLLKYIFQHPDGLPDIGLWIMPDNNSDGMLENWVEASITDAGQIKLLRQAKASIGQIKAPFFDIKTHQIKAEIYTWLAWQKMPDKDIASVVGDKLIDLNSINVKNLSAWAKDVFV